MDMNQLFGSHAAGRSTLSLCMVQTPVDRNFFCRAAQIMISQIERKGPILLVNASHCFSTAKPTPLRLDLAAPSSTHVISIPCVVFRAISSQLEPLHLPLS